MVERRTETKMVKDALAAAGIKAKVRHGTGTARGWLHITIPEQEHHTATNALMGQAVMIAKKVTGRHGKYDGCINVNFRLQAM